MSRARVADERVENDAYLTPARPALAICEHLARRGVFPSRVIEPSAGAGAFVRAARLVWPAAHVTANEIDRRRRVALLRAGAHVVLFQDWPRLARRLAAAPHDGRPRLIIGNPPYRFAEEHVDAALACLQRGERLAFLLRINFLGATKRVEFWNRPGLEEVAPVAPRPSFLGSGSDGTEYALFTWLKGYREPARLAPPIVWKPERKRGGIAA
jgi:hypothetical protein